MKTFTDFGLFQQEKNIFAEMSTFHKPWTPFHPTFDRKQVPGYVGQFYQGSTASSKNDFFVDVFEHVRKMQWLDSTTYLEGVLWVDSTTFWWEC